MKYFVKRGDEKFGPYSLADIQQYVQSGNISLGDLAQSEGMSDWFPVSQVIGNIPIPVTSYGAAAAPAMEPVVELVPLPPNLHWAVLLLLEIFTRQLFNLIWAMVQANWARKLIKNNKPLVLVAMYPAGIIAGIVAEVVGQAVTAMVWDRRRSLYYRRCDRLYHRHLQHSLSHGGILQFYRKYRALVERSHDVFFQCNLFAISHQSDCALEENRRT